MRKLDGKNMTREEADELIRQLPGMDTGQLTTMWAALFGTVCYTKRRDFIRRRLEWRINTLVSGGISERAMKRAEDLADDTLLRLKSRALVERAERQEGSKPVQRVIVRVFKGLEHRVYPDERGGFTYAGKYFHTLSEVSTLICGYYISGTKFFGIRKQAK